MEVVSGKVEVEAEEESEAELELLLVIYPLFVSIRLN